MNCHICGESSVGQCQNCWKFYCKEHGDVFCQDCKDSADSRGFARESMTVSGGVLGGGPDTLPPEERRKLEEMLASVPRRRVLKRVLGVNQSLTIDDIEVRVISLELYDDAFDVTWTIRMLDDSGDQPLSMWRMTGFPGCEWEAADNLGNKYSGSPGGGGGSSSEYRMQSSFAPAVDEAASSLRLVLQEILWMAIGPGRRSRIQPGPWHFDIPLT